MILHMKKIVIFTMFFLAFTHSNAQLKIPSATLKTLDGKSTNIQTICSANKLVVISLWATWCAPCKKELDAINDEYETIKEDVDFILLAVSIDDARTVKLVKPLVNGKGWEFDVLLDTNNDFKRKLGVITVPATVVVKNGEIIKKTAGYKPGDEEELFEFLKIQSLK